MSWEEVRQYTLDYMNHENISLIDICAQLNVPFRCINYSYIFGNADLKGTFALDFKKALTEWYHTKMFKDPIVSSDLQVVEFLKKTKSYLYNSANLMICMLSPYDKVHWYFFLYGKNAIMINLNK